MALNQQEITSIRICGQKLGQILDILADMVKPGANLLDIEARAGEEAAKAGGRPSFLGFHGYPATTCLSVNEGVVHCIPADYQLKEGDILTIDMGLEYEGLHTDAAVTVPVGQISPDVRRLLSGTYQAMLAGVSQAQPGNRVGDISRAIAESLKSSRLTTFREFVGHQIGHSLHEGFFVPNFYDPKSPDPLLSEGMAMAIEPITGLGREEVIFSGDGWSTYTADGQPACQYETSILVGPSGPEILVPIDATVKKLKIS